MSTLRDVKRMMRNCMNEIVHSSNAERADQIVKEAARDALNTLNEKQLCKLLDWLYKRNTQPANEIATMIELMG